MSRIKHVLENGNIFAYGLDKPTGGYYWQVLDPLEKNELNFRNGLTLSQLQKDLKEGFEITCNIAVLVQDFYKAEKPTEFQINNAACFGYNTPSMLLEVEKDIIENFREYIYPILEKLYRDGK